MTKRHDLFCRMREALADCYPHVSQARLFASDVGLKLAAIDFSGAALAYCEEILNEAERVGKVEPLLALALEQAPAYAGLAALLAEYRTLSAAEAQPRPVARVPEPGRETVTDLSPPAPLPGATMFRIREPVRDFTDREEHIKTLVARLSHNGSRADAAAVTIFALHGMGGIGKTELARVIASRVRDHYGDAGFELELQPGARPLTVGQVYAAIIHAAKPRWVKLPDEEAALQGVYLDALAGRRGILLLDNAAGAEQVCPLLPPPAGWAILVTSRLTFDLPGGESVDLTLLQLPDAVKFLARRLTAGRRWVLSEEQEAFIANHPPEQLAESPLGRLARLCGRLPLALRVAAAYLIQYRDVDLTTYAAELQATRLDKLRVNDLEVARVLRVSLDRLAETDATLAQRWCDLAVFPAPFDRAAVAAVWNLEKAEASRSLSVLVHQSLVEYDQVTQSYSLHDLLADLARESSAAAGPAHDELLFRHAEYYLKRGYETRSLYAQGSGHVLESLKLFDGIWPHLVQDWRALAGRTDARALRWLNAMPRAVMFMLEIRETVSRCIDYLQAALAAAQALKQRMDEGAHLGNLGVAYAALGKTKRAIEAYEQALDIARETGDRSSEGAWLSNLGVANADLSEPAIAITCSERALTIAQELGDRRAEGIALGSLGIVYHRAKDEPQRAIDYHERALAIAQEIGDRREEGNALNNLGIALMDLGEPQPAITRSEEALTIAREIRDRRAEAKALGNLGLGHRALGDPRAAIAYHAAALAIAREIGDQSLEVTWLNNLGLAYADLREPRRADKCHQEALAIAQETGDRRSTAATLAHLGGLHAALGETRRAVEYYERAWVLAREAADRPNEGAWLSSLGMAYADLGNTQRAIECTEQALAIAREIGDRRREGIALGNLGIAHRAAGDPQQAITYHKQALAIAQEIGDRRGEGNALGSLGGAFADLGELRQAIDYHERALAIARELGDRRGQGQSLGNLGTAYADLGELRRAIGCHEQRLAIALEQRDRRGESIARGNLGNAYLLLGEPRRAIEYFRERLAIAKEIGDHRGEGIAQGSLGRARVELGEVAEAIMAHEAALLIRRSLTDIAGQGEALSSLGRAYDAAGDHERGAAYHRQGIDLLRVPGSRQPLAAALVDSAENCVARSELTEADLCLREALTLAGDIGARRIEGLALYGLGRVAGLQRDIPAARDHLERALLIFEQLGLPQSEPVRDRLAEMVMPD